MAAKTTPKKRSTSAQQLQIIQTCGDNCPYYYHGKFSGRHICYKEGMESRGREVPLGHECDYELMIDAPKRGQMSPAMVPYATVSDKYFKQLAELRRQSRPVHYLMVLADQEDKRFAEQQKRKRKSLKSI